MSPYHLSSACARLLEVLLADLDISAEAHLILNAVRWHTTFPQSRNYYLVNGSTVKDVENLQ